MGAATNNHHPKQVVVVDCSEQLFYKEELRDVACSLCGKKPAYVLVAPKNDAKVFEKHRLCPKCLADEFDCLMSI